MYQDLAEHYDRIYADKDYAAESARLTATALSHCPSAKTLLDVACGTGGHLRHLSGVFKCEGVDISERMLALARRKAPGVALTVADMTMLDLGRKFDLVTCLFSAIGYVGTVDRLKLAVRRMANHLEPGGALLIEPWITPEKWIAGGVHMDTFESDDVKIARMMLSEPVERGRMVFEYLVGTRARVIQARDEHKLGWFSHSEYSQAFEEAGLDTRFDPDGLAGRGLYVGVSASPGDSQKRAR